MRALGEVLTRLLGFLKLILPFLLFFEPLGFTLAVFSRLEDCVGIGVLVPIIGKLFTIEG